MSVLFQSIFPFVFLNIFIDNVARYNGIPQIPIILRRQWRNFTTLQSITLEVLDIRDTKSETSLFACLTIFHNFVTVVIK